MHIQESSIVFFSGFKHEAWTLLYMLMISNRKNFFCHLFVQQYNKYLIAPKMNLRRDKNKSIQAKKTQVKTN